MGLFSKLMGGGGGGVRGTAQVTSCSQYQGRAVYSMCRMQLIVQADGVPPTAVEFEGLVHRKRWPQPGMTLPVSVDPSNPQNADIQWDEVPDSRDRARANAESMAAMMRGDGAAGGFGGAQVVNLSGGRPTEEQLAKLRALGINVGGQAAAPEPDDQLERLERLAALRAQGMLTEEEFQEQKRRLLGG